MLATRHATMGVWYPLVTLLVLSVQHPSYLLLNSEARTTTMPAAESTSKPATTALVVGLATASTNEEARAIAERLVVRRLAACVQIVPAIESIYEWKGKLEKSNEVLLIIKTQRDLTQAVVNAVKEIHTYEVPEVVFTDVVDGNRDYIEWARAATQPKSS